MIVHLDTDIGSDIDDGLALHWLLFRDVLLAGVTTVTGEAGKRAAMARAIVGAHCRVHTKERPPIPILAGHERPLRVDPMQKKAALYDPATCGPPMKNDPDDAVELLYHNICQYGQDLTLLAIGPLTNIALMMERYPDAEDRLGRMVIMGGHFGLADPDVVVPHEDEWNILNDPHAAARVFAARTPKLILGLDVTHHCQSGPEIRETDYYRSLPPLLINGVESLLEQNGCVRFHDPMAAVALIHDDLCETRGGKVFARTDSPPYRTILHETENGFDRVAVAFDTDRFFDLLYREKHSEEESGVMDACGNMQEPLRL